MGASEPCQDTNPEQHASEPVPDPWDEPRQLHDRIVVDDWDETDDAERVEMVPAPDDGEGW